ncbi:MAG: hypothetical protein R3F29_02025 [Planctomycetota bacterium]
MADKRSASLSMVLWPAVITLVVTTLRFLGEYYAWNPDVFESAPGKPGLFGISWLIFVFGLWFGIKLQRAGAGPARRGRALLLGLLAIGVTGGGMFGASYFELMWWPDADHPGEPRGLGWMLGIVAAGGVIAAIAWGRAAGTMLVYGVLARIPVIAMTWICLTYDLGTHYTAFAPGFPVPPRDEQFLQLSFPHLTVWPIAAVIGGTFCASLGALLAGGGKKK